VLLPLLPQHNDCGGIRELLGSTRTASAAAAAAAAAEILNNNRI
jgi:hypothetical protein